LNSSGLYVIKRQISARDSDMFNSRYSAMYAMLMTGSGGGG
jgi:hypothetical protein